jgi:3-oxoacyl-[acyl-carrier protein] reductase
VALVSGAARGIGRAVTESFLEQGCRVALVDRLPAPELRAASSDLAKGDRARGYSCDIRKAEAVDRTVESVVRDFGGLHFLVNNAGITDDGVVWKLSDEQWQNVLDTNLTGSFHLIRAVAPRLRSQRFGRIVNISSINALRGKFGQANYAASKAGQLGLTLSAARELAREKITVNAIAPGFIETDLTAKLSEAVRTQARSETLLGRLGRPGDIAAAVLFLCSDGAEQITGIVLRVDGGQCL